VTTQAALEEFLAELESLTRRTGIKIKSECDGPWLEEAELGDGYGYVCERGTTRLGTPYLSDIHWRLIR
jgi:hypothetical protein